VANVSFTTIQTFTLGKVFENSLEGYAERTPIGIEHDYDQTSPIELILREITGSKLN
jgi:hypothetical protein